MKLSPEWTELEKKWGSRPSLRGDLAELRTGYDELSNSLRGQAPDDQDDNLDIRDETIYGGLTLRIYAPEAAKASETLPIGVYARGGGYTLGDLDTSFEDRLCRYIAQHAPCVLVSVGYRRAPEYPVPSQLYDYLGAYNWAWNNAQELNGSAEKMFAIGASCGGGMAISIALKYIEYGMPQRVKGIVALAPMTIHPACVPERYKKYLKSWEENSEGPIVDFQGMMAIQGINGSTGQCSNPDVFAALHDRLDQLPPTYIATCGADVIRDDGTIIKVALDEANVPCKLDNYDGYPHFFWIYPEIAEGDRFRKKAASAVGWVMEQHKTLPPRD